MDKGKKVFSYLAAALSFFGLAIISFQIYHIKIEGQTLCLNHGCSVVEKLTLISPLLFNLLGLIYFIFLFLASLLSKRFRLFSNILNVLLIAGVAAEGILLSFQINIAQTFCAYCLLICGLILFILLFKEPRLFLLGIIIISVEVGISSILRYQGISYPAESFSLDRGTYGIKTCSEPEKQLYLIFSQDCPHCKRVIEALKGCSRCEFHFNPITHIDRSVLPDLELQERYDPNINIMVLKLLDIGSIPVLIARDEDGMTFIRGDTNIIHYIGRVCFDYSPLLEEHDDLLDGFEDSGACSLDENCAEKKNKIP